MPIGTIFLVKLFLDMFWHQVLNLDVIDSVFSLSIIQMITYFIASAIMSELSGMSIMLSFEITSVIWDSYNFFM